MSGCGSHQTLGYGAAPDEKAQHVDGSVAQPKTPAVTPDSTGTAATPAQTLTERFHAGLPPFGTGFRIRQLWACLTCGTRRQWGTVRFSKAIAAAKEAGEVIVHEPILWCAKCKNNRPHVWSSAEGVS